MDASSDEVEEDVFSDVVQWMEEFEVMSLKECEGMEGLVSSSLSRIFMLEGILMKWKKSSLSMDK